ncbi:Metallo-hydrolase/oxidoreductase, partial [Fragilariopsis cylindrus CCMP1102]
NELYMTWIGHSTCLFQIDYWSILTDPMFSTRASPYKHWIGIPRDVQPAYTIQDILNHQQQQQQQQYICCITHDHYDHMDMNSVRELKDHVQLWIVPLGIADWLVERCSINRKQIIELEWWQNVRIIRSKKKTNKNGRRRRILTITCCPASHWSGRTILDRNKRLWCSFAIIVKLFDIFFCGDTSYPNNFPLFRQIGDALGPFDLSCIPIGAYLPKEMNKDAHCDPYEALQIHNDIQSKQSIAIHWGSFNLGEEPLYEPPQLLYDAI